MHPEELASVYYKIVNKHCLYPKIGDRNKLKF